MKKFLILVLSTILCYFAAAQEGEEAEIKKNKTIPLTIYLTPILDGASLGAEWRFNKRFALNIYGYKRKSDHSIYYKAKVDENLGEISLKIYSLNRKQKKYNLFIAPCFGFRNTYIDRRSTFDPFSRTPIEIIFIQGSPELRANSKYVLPLYFGFDRVSKTGIKMELAAGIGYQKSWGDKNKIGSRFIPFYIEPINFRSRLLFGYQF